jgi:CheY-like chemotaxis protein
VVTLKRALIVDDSKSARVVLSRLLEKHDLAVETRDSAEAALEYLEQNRPDVIFMDHVMPGMDGLSAVQLIKKDPSIASIPILMYTSQDGAIYADAAKASGADGVLPKQMSPADISDALVRLKVVPGRGVAAAADAAASSAPTPTTVPHLSAQEVRAIVEPLIRDQAGDLRRYFGAELESLSGRLAADVSRRIESAAADIVHRLTPPPVEPPPPPPRPWALIGFLCAAVAAVAVLGVTLLRYQGEITGMRATIDRQSAALAATLPAVSENGGAVTAGSWPSERHPLGYGDVPFNPARLAQLSNWLGALEKRGFVGSAHIAVSIADYCLAGNPGEGYSMAPAEMPAASCDLRGSPPDEGRPATEREPAALSALVAGVSERTHGEIKAEVVYVKASGYPAAGANAGQWNAAAAKGHYVEFAAQPRSP